MLKHFDNEASKKKKMQKKVVKKPAAFEGHDAPVEYLHREEFCKQ